MVIGQYEHCLDAKDRFRIPSKLKKGNDTKYVLLKGTNGCIFLFTKTYFEKDLMPKLETIPTFDLDQQKAIRLVLSSAFLVESDTQGRLLLPSALKSYAGIDKTMLSIGLINRIEIWEPSRWATYCQQDYDVVASILGDKV